MPQGCFTNWAEGPLVVDPKYGTAIIVGEVQTPVAWRPGFTGQRVGSEVEVLDPQGNVVALTGHSYRIAGGYISPGSSGGWPGLPVEHAFWACDFVNLTS